ncbi:MULTISPECIES: chlorophyllase/cutinase-like alpha/beta fold protein [unclassified Streptomyces]|uniref:poly(ethylene terephthalate) hydrolase family protein n=1 Tax=unclassified Streptomyces TaxID=2593676 RepID=UPI002966A03D|nr:acetylxylan esterase [Streptomyces sp. SJL17-1]
MPGRTSRVWGGLLLAAVMAVCTAPGTAGAVADAGTAGTIPSVGTDWGRTGPYEVDVDIEAVHTFYYPRTMGQSGERHPVIIWGNGTGAVPGIYSSLLRHWASQGFIVAAANTPTSNFAISMRAGIDVLEHRNADSSSRFHGKVDLDHIASAGHSQGGAAAVNAAVDPRVDTAVPIQPGPLTDPDLMDEPVFYLAGQRDLTVWPALVKALYRDTDHVPAVYGEVRGAGHLSSIGDGGDFRAPTTAWLRYWLLGDENARGMFFGPGCGYCVDSDLWSGWDRNAKALQIPGPAA